MDPFTMAADVISIVVLIGLAFFGSRVIRSFKQSKQALAESASIISVIVDALTARAQQSESIVNQIQTEVDTLKTRSSSMEWEQATLRSSHLQLLQTMQEILTNDKRLIADLEQLKTKPAPVQKTLPPVEAAPKRGGAGTMIGPSDIVGSLTPTERETLEILNREGPKGAPELGKRLKKSREHTSRLMKKLYLEGYVDRESNRAPFRYRLTEPVRAVLDPKTEAATAKAFETS